MYQNPHARIIPALRFDTWTLRDSGSRFPGTGSWTRWSRMFDNLYEVACLPQGASVIWASCRNRETRWIDCVGGKRSVSKPTRLGIARQKSRCLAPLVVSNKFWRAADKEPIPTTCHAKIMFICDSMFYYYVWKSVWFGCLCFSKSIKILFKL